MTGPRTVAVLLADLKEALSYVEWHGSDTDEVFARLGAVVEAAERGGSAEGAAIGVTDEHRTDPEKLHGDMIDAVDRFHRAVLSAEHCECAVQRDIRVDGHESRCPVYRF